MISKSELLYAALLDSHGDLDRSPAKLVEELLALDAKGLNDVLAQILDKSPSALINLLSSRQWMLKEVLKGADQATLGKLLQDPIHYSMMARNLSQNQKEEVRSNMMAVSSQRSTLRSLDKTRDHYMIKQTVGEDQKMLRKCVM